MPSKLEIIVALCLLFGAFCISPCCGNPSAPNYFTADSDLTFVPAEHEIVSDYNDGVTGYTVGGLFSLVHWRDLLAVYLLIPLDFFEDTELGYFSSHYLYPLLMIFLSSLAGVVLFSRKNPDRLSPTATIIIAFLKENPISTEVTIRKGVGKSRGAVSYQLHRLLFDGKIYSAEISGKTCYSMSPILIDSPETSVYFMRNNKQQAEIISYLCSHPWATRKEIADAVSLPVDGVRYHLKNIDVGILQKGIREDAEIYAVEDWVKQLWEK